MARFVVILSSASQQVPRGDFPGMVVESFDLEAMARDFVGQLVPPYIEQLNN